MTFVYTHTHLFITVTLQHVCKIGMLVCELVNWFYIPPVDGSSSLLMWVTVAVIPP